MERAIRILHKRRIRRIRGETSARRLRRTGAVLLTGLLLAAATLIGALCLPYRGPAPILTLGTRPPSTRFYDRTGTHLLAEYSSARAEEAAWVTPAELDCLVSALAARRGWNLAESGGVFPAAGMQAFADSLFGRANPAADAAAELGAMRGDAVSVWDRARLAGMLAAVYPRNELVEWLLNVRLYGRKTVGADDAALAYFGLHAGNLDPEQCATLEALAGDPDLASDAAGLRTARDALLNRMADSGWIEIETWKQSVRSMIDLLPETSGDDKLVAPFIRLAGERLAGRYPKGEPARAGLRVITSWDFSFAEQALCAAQSALARGGEPIGTLTGGVCGAAALLGPSGDLAAGDYALAVIEPESGELLAYIESARGGDSAAVGAAGTAEIPFLYLAAFTRGFTPASMLLDIPREGFSADPGDTFAGPVSARRAIQERRRSAAFAVERQVGPDGIGRIFSQLGLTVGGPDSRSGQPAELLPLTEAYALLASGGVQASEAGGAGPVVVLRVERNGGGADSAFDGRSTRRVLNADLAYLMQNILSDERWLDSMEAPALSGSAHAYAAALGESRAPEGGWAFAISPGVTVGVHSTGAGGAEAAWRVSQAASGWALRGMEPRSWIEPAGIVHREVCIPSGLLPGLYCPDTRSEVFLAGTEPSRTDSYYRPVAVNAETGLLATLWTPLAQIEREVFFFLPAEADEWARSSGFRAPPDVYDTLPESFPYFENLHFSNPAPLAIVRGTIVLRGTAAMPTMLRFRLQAGWGLYPGEWYLLAESNQPAAEAALAEWDTRGRDGVWSLLLTALLPDQRLVSVAIPVTVDNTPPVVRWVVPDSARWTTAAGEPLILQADASDSIELAYVEFFLDGNAMERLECGPFSVRWEDLPPGVHRVKVRAVDTAGNSAATSEIEVTIPE